MLYRALRSYRRGLRGSGAPSLPALRLRRPHLSTSSSSSSSSSSSFSSSSSSSSSSASPPPHAPAAAGAAAPSYASHALAWARFLGRRVTAANLRLYWPQLAAAAGGVVVLYGIGSVSLHVATTLLQIDMEQVFKVGFFTGVGTVSLLAALALRALRAQSLRPDTVVRAALYALQRNGAVAEELGAGALRAGELAAFNVRDAHFAVSKLGWVEPRVSALFQVVGERGEGMVTCEAVKHKGGLQFMLIALDLPAGARGREARLLLVAGREERLHVRGSLRGFLQAERARFVPQDRGALQEEDLIAEQAALPASEDADETAPADRVPKLLPQRGGRLA